LRQNAWSRDARAIQGGEVTKDLVTARARSRAIGRPIGVPWLGVVGAALAVAAAVAVLVLAGSGDGPRPLVFEVPGQPTGLVAASDRVWVAGQRAGAVWMLDAETGRRIGPPLRTGGAPARLAIGATGMWVADTARGAVVPVQWRPRPRVFPAVELGADVSDVALSARAVWALSSAEGVVRALEPGDRRVRELPVGANPVALAADDRWVVAAVAGSGTIARIDARARRLAGPPLRVGGQPVAVAVSDGVAWVVDGRGGTVGGVDLRTGARVGPPVPVGERLVAVAADGDDVYVLCSRERSLVHVRGGEVRSRREVGADPTAVALDARHVWVADAASGTVMRFDR
jgi:streptogramin lyase